MRKAMIRMTVATAAATGSMLLGMPAAAAPAASMPTSGIVIEGDGGHRGRGGDFRFGRRHHRFPFVTPFLFGGFQSFGFSDSFGGFSRGCDVFLWRGDLEGYVLCRVG